MDVPSSGVLPSRWGELMVSVAPGEVGAGRWACTSFHSLLWRWTLQPELGMYYAATKEPAALAFSTRSACQQLL